MPRALKVFRTPIGFHDAYVAATSRKAALAAWGSDADLFARGIAEEVTDDALKRAPLAQPGAVIRVARGTADDHLAALPKTRPAKTKPATKPRRTPRPRRDPLDEAEAALAAAEQDLAAKERDLASREKAIADERKALDRDRKARLARLSAARDDAKENYASALAAWEP